MSRTHLSVAYGVIQWFHLFLIISLSLFSNFGEHILLVLAKNSSHSNADYTAKSLEICDHCHIYMGGLFPVHAPKYIKSLKPPKQAEFAIENLIDTKQQTVDQTDTNTIDTVTICGAIKKERGIQRLEAMLYAIDLINADPNLLADFKLGAKIFDTCDRDMIAMERSIEFVTDHFLLNSDEIVNDFFCEATDPNQLLSKAGGFTPKKLKSKIQRRKVIGVIGAASSSVSVQVANLLRVFQVPQISYSSSSPELSNKERFPYFSRVLPSDTLQAKAMADLVYSLEWNYITTISEEGNAGGIDTFINNVKNRKICISESYTLSQTSSEQHVRNMLMEIHDKSTARGVVMFMQDHNIRKLLGIVSELNLTEHFLWVASDGWGTKREPIASNDLAAHSAITFSPKFYEIKEFNDYFENLKPATNTRNPWFNEFWEEQFNCTSTGTRSTQASIGLNRKQCTGEEELQVTQDGFIHFVIDSVFAMAHGINNLLKEKCDHLISNRDLLLKCQQTIDLKGPELLNSIRNVEFISITGREVKFIKNKENSGDGLAPFEVFQYQKNDLGEFEYVKIAEWESDKPFTIQKSILKWDDGTSNIPRSICKEECNMGEVKQGDDCCWVCVKCDETQYVSTDSQSCIKCTNGYGPNANKTGCEKLPVEYMELNTAFTLVPIIVSSFGIILTCFTIGVFIRYSQTPIIKACGRELCYVLLAGIMSCYLVTFPLVTRPTYFSCFILRFGVSFSLTVCLSAIFTKTFRLSRIFNNSVKTSLKASCVSPHSQLVICFTIISVQIVGIIVWVVISPPGIDYDYTEHKRVILQCSTKNLYLVVSCGYSFFLAILCTVYAVKTRKIPSNFNEARFIGFTMYSICIIWIAFVPIYFGTTAAAGTKASPKNNYKIQLTTLAMCLSLSATVILSCLFLPKLRVVLLKPDKNVRGKGKITMRTAANASTAMKSNNATLSNINVRPSVASVNIGMKYTAEKLLTITPAGTTDDGSIKKDSSNLISDEKSLITLSRQVSLKSKPLISKSSISSTSNTIQSNSKEGLILSREDSAKNKENVVSLSNQRCILPNVSDTRLDQGIVKIPDIEQTKDHKESATEKKQTNIETFEADYQTKEKSDSNSRFENGKDILLVRRSKNNETSRDTSPENYEYMVTLRKVPLRSWNQSSTRSSTFIQSDRDKTTTEESNRSSLKSLNEIDVDEEFFNENTIKEVVEQCFDELSKNKKITNTHLYLKDNKNLHIIKEIDSKNFNDFNPTVAKSHNKVMFLPENFPRSSSKNDISTDMLSPDTESADSTIQTMSQSQSQLQSSSETSISLKNTCVQKIVTKNGSQPLPTNTILLSNDMNKNNYKRLSSDSTSNDMYSLKITFV